MKDYLHYDLIHLLRGESSVIDYNIIHTTMPCYVLSPEKDYNQLKMTITDLFQFDIWETVVYHNQHL